MDRPAEETEQQKTSDEPFSLLVSVMGTNDVVRERHARIPEGIPISAGYARDVSRTSVPRGHR